MPVNGVWRIDQPCVRGFSFFNEMEKAKDTKQGNWYTQEQILKVLHEAETSGVAAGVARQYGVSVVPLAQPVRRFDQVGAGRALAGRLGPAGAGRSGASGPQAFRSPTAECPRACIAQRCAPAP